jgi:protocatechuate 3,4-dioxygenase beta subunit
MKTLLAAVLLLIVIAASIFWVVREPGAPAETAAPGMPAAALSEPQPQGEVGLAAPAAAMHETAPAEQRRDATARAFDPALARHVAGRVELPAGTPADERLEVAAVERDGEPRSVSEAWDDFSGNELLAQADVGPSGDFELAIPPDAKKSWIVLRSRYLRLASAIAVPDGSAAAVLKPELGAWVTGRLVLPDGAAAAEPKDFELELVPDARAVLSGGMMSRPRESRRKGDLASDLSFEWGGAMAGIPLDVRVRPEHFAAQKSGRLELRPGEHRELEIALKPGGTLAGTVHDDQGQPVDGAELTVEIDPVMMGRGGYEVRTGKTGADGAFHLDAVTAGHLKLRIERSGMLDDGFDVELGEGESRTDLALVLSGGSAISGRLSWPDGSPVADAKVSVDFDPASMNGMAAFNAMRGGSGEGKTDAQGAFEVRGLGKGPFLVRASIERDGETWRARKSPVPPATTGLELQLLAPVAIEGRVVDDAGAPVKAFKVHAATQTSGFLRGIGADTVDKEIEDEQGHFRLSGLAAGSWTLTASSKDYGRGDDLNVELPSAGAVELRLPRAAIVRGTVVSPEGQPVAGATIEPEVGLEGLIERQSGNGGPRAVSDEEGRFELGGLTPGSVTIAARHEGFAKSLPTALEIEPSAVTEGVQLSLRRGGRITGEVYGKDGKPLGGATLLAQQPADVGNQRFGTSDDAGLFAFDSVTPGSWQVMTMPGGGGTPSGDGDNFADFFAEMKLQVVEVVEGEEVHVVLGAPPANPVHVTGRVRVDGRAEPGVLVSFILDGSKGMADFKFASAGPDGGFAFDLNQPGNYLVQVQRLTGGAGQQQNVQLNAVVPDEREFHIDLDLPVGAISGRVRGPDGQPMAGARVTLSVDGPISNRTFMGGNYAEIATDEDGRYELTWLRAGSYSIAAGGPALGGMFGGAGGDVPGRQVQDDVTVREGERVEGVDFRLREPGRLKGIVRDATGAPVKDAAIFLRDADGRFVERFAMVASDAGGRFSYSGIAPGEYSLSLRNSTLVSPTDAAITIREGEETSVELGLGPGTILHVLLSDEDGNAVDCAVSVRDASGRQVNGVWSLADLMAMMQSGEFSSKEQRVGPLPPGEYHVEAIAVDGRRATKPVQLNGQPERKLNLRIKD